MRLLQAIESAGTYPYQLSDEELASVNEGLAEADAKAFVSNEDMIAFWNRNLS